MGFYNDISNAGWGDDIAVFTGNEIADLWAALNNGDSIDDIFNNYGSGMHEGDYDSSLGDPWGGSGGSNWDKYWDEMDARSRAENEKKNQRDDYIDVDDHDS